MSNLRKRPNSSHSASDADSCKRQHHEDDAETAANKIRNALLAHWTKIKKEAESSDTMPKKVVRRILAPQRIRLSVANTSQDGISPKDILPQEMWHEIIKQISKPVDLMNCAETCTMFKIIVEEMKTEKLFGSVLPHIAKYFKFGPSQNREILKCRLVCRQWNKAVESFADCDALWQPRDETACGDIEVGNYLQHFTNRRNREFLDSTYTFQIPHRPQLDTGIPYTPPLVRIRMEVCAKNPIIGRAVNVYCENPENPGVPNFCTEMKKFLNRSGHHLSSLRLLEGEIYEPVSYKDIPCLPPFLQPVRN